MRTAPRVRFKIDRFRPRDTGDQAYGRLVIVQGSTQESKSWGKIAIVLGPSRAPGKLRVRTYSHATRDWSRPHTVEEDGVTDPDVYDLTAGQHRTLAHALKDGADAAFCRLSGSGRALRGLPGSS